SIFRSLGKTANLAGGVVRPHRNGLAHGKPPQFAILNHAAIDSGIPRESVTQRLGITRYCHYEFIFAGFDDPAAVHILTAAISFTSPTRAGRCHGSRANFSSRSV